VRTLKQSSHIVALGLALALPLCLPALPVFAQPSTPPARVVELHVDGQIDPVVAEYVDEGITQANRDGAALILITMDTPGGLDTAMRDIIKVILNSPVPVVGYVAPGGARAASAGTYILYAAHVAAMAPATNLGAATPVEIGMPMPGGGADPVGRAGSAASAAAAPGHDAMAAKRVNDAAAYIRSLAQLRGRDTAWAEQAVRESVSLSANDALSRKVIDLVAVDLNDLLRQLDGRVIAIGESGAGSVKLATANASVVVLEPDWRGRLLAVLSEPSLVLMLMMLGVYGLLFEFMNPGYVLPGVIGGVALLLALWGLQMLPVNYAGLALILLGMAFLVAEAFVPSFGALGIGGAAALVVGSVILIDPEGAGGYEVPVAFSVALALVSAALVFVTVYLAVKARRRPVVSGREDLFGAGGEVLEAFEGGGWARVRGENWRVVSAAPLGPGQQVRVVDIDGLTLRVEPLNGNQ